MSDAICVDASVLVALVLVEPTTERLRTLWRVWLAEGRRFVAPPALLFEMAGVLERKMRSGVMEPTVARMILASAEGLAAQIEQPAIVGGLQMAWDLALAYRLRVLDACYLAVARQERAELWTLDHELARRTGAKTP